MLLYENKKLKFLNTLKIGLNPFKKFVSTGEIKEELVLIQSRSEILESIRKQINDEKNFILPVIGDIGTGKTHLFWELKNKLYYHNIIYVSLENVYRRFYYNIYSEFIEEMGPNVLRSITNEICNKWGAHEKKFGFFYVSDIDKVRKTAFEELSDKFEEKIALNDIINAITSHQLDPYKKIEAERWLLGELMDFKDLSHLNLLYDLRKKTYAFTILKIIIENAILGSVLFIDDFDKIISLMKVEKDSEVIFEPGWLYDEKLSSPNGIAAQKILDKILKLNGIKGIRIIITLKTIESLKEIKKIIEEKNKNLLSAFKKPLFLSNFAENDIYDFYKQKIEDFLINFNILNFLEEYTESYFPLNKKILKSIYHSTKGNPREIIKYLIKIFNEIIYSDENIEDILKKYETLN